MIKRECDSLFIGVFILIPIPDFSYITTGLYVLLIAMIAFLAFVWSAKKVLSLLGIENLKAHKEAKKEIAKEDYRKQVREAKTKIRNRVIAKGRTKNINRIRKERTIAEKAQHRRDVFNNAKRAKDLREDELIKASNREELNFKINNRT